jgi:hypothetical protein
VTLDISSFYACETIRNFAGTFEWIPQSNDQTLPSVHLFRWRTFWVSVANCDVISSGNSTVMKLGKCVMKVFC